MAAEVKGHIEALRSGDAGAKEAAARALKELADNNDANEIKAIVEAGAIAPLVALVRAGSKFAKSCAAAALYKLADEANKKAIVAAGGIPALVALMRDGDDDGKLHASLALRSLTLWMDLNLRGELRPIPPHKKAFVEAGGIAAAIATVRDGNEAGKESAVILLDKLVEIEDDEKSKTLLAHEGGIPPLVDLLYESDDKWVNINACRLLYLMAGSSLKFYPDAGYPVEDALKTIIEAGGVAALQQVENTKWAKAFEYQGNS